MFDVQAFYERHEKGLATLKRTGTRPDAPDEAVYAVSQARFDPATGEQVEDEVVGVERAALLARREALAAELFALDALLKDAEALAPDEVLAVKR